MSTTEAVGTISGLMSTVLNSEPSGSLRISISAKQSGSTTASGTATAANTAVFLAAVRNAALPNRLTKF